MTPCAPAVASGRWAHDAHARDVSERGRPGLAHDRHEFAVEDVEHRLDAALTEGSQPPGLRPADADRGRPERERLEDVGAAADAAVDEHRDAALDGGHHLGQAIDAGAQRLFVAPAVVRYDDSVRAVL